MRTCSALGGLALMTALAGGCGDDCRPAASPAPTALSTGTATIAPLTPTRGDDPGPTATPPAPASSTPPPTPTPAPPTGTPSATEPAPVAFDVVASAPRFIIPGPDLPGEFETFASNNNVDILFFDDRLYLAWRAAPHHFAGPDTHLYVMSSGDGGSTWTFEHDIFLGTDMREPRLLGFAGVLQLMFFEGGSDAGQFTPRRLWRTRRLGPAQWSELEVLTDGGEVPWDVKVRDGVAYRTSYEGDHYGSGDTSEIAVFFKQTTDGTTWSPVGGRAHVYYGGVSEVAFELDADGSLYAVTRNEDGDDTGFGSHVCYAPAAALGDWQCPPVTDPERYDSPEMFRHGDDIYLVARRDVGGPYDAGDTHLSLAERRSRYLIAYSLRPKRTALYKIDKAERKVVHVMDLPGTGDTAFASVQQTGPDTYLVANYTSPLDDPDISWLRGQTSPRGTQIYLLTLTFMPYVGPPRSATPTWTPTPTPTPRGGEQGARIGLAPVFAAPGTPLAIAWPDGAVGQLDLGDGTLVDATTTTHTYAAGADRIYAVAGSFETGGIVTQVRGTVARSSELAISPLNGFLLTTPSEPVVQQVIRGIMPEFSFAFDATTLAVATDPTGGGELGFDEVALWTLERGGDGSFATAPAELVLELSGVGGTATGLLVHVRDAIWSGILGGNAFDLAGDLVLEDVVAAAVELAGLDHAAAVGFLSGLFGFDPSDPPETVAIEGTLPIVRRSE